MEHLIGIVTNRFLLITLISWLLAQLSKVVIHAIINRKINFKRMVEDGGMPSAHSATVWSFATYTAIACGTASFQFAASVILALIVCRDAIGVRREAGKQAVVLNNIMKSFKEHKNSSVVLKELVGHTPLQVVIGGILGVISAIACHLIITILSA